MFPICGIMHGFETRLSEIRYLIMMIPSCCQCLAQHRILMLAKLLRSLLEPSLFDHPCQHAARLYRELISGNMLRQSTGRRYLQHFFQGITPLIISQLRKSEDEIDADIPHSGIFQYRIGFPGYIRAVPAVHELQYLVIEGLHTHTYTVHPESQKSFDIVLSLIDNIFRIHFHRELIVRPSVADLTQSLEQPLKNT